MLHSEYTILMSLILDGEGDDLDKVRLQQHLRSCDACASTWQRWQELDRRFVLAPLLPVPVDLAANIEIRLDLRLSEQRRQRWIMLGLALVWSVAVVFTVAVLGVVNRWDIQLAPDQGPLVAAISVFTSTGHWIWREVVGVWAQVGAPTIAAVTGILLCATCVLIMAWLWLVARLTVQRQGALAASEWS